jgi:endoglycosylceramidase
MRTQLLLCVLLFAHVYSFYIDTTTHQFIDEDGRESFFHGMNVIYKRFPYYPILDHFDPQYSFSAKDMQIMADLGFNIVRLGTQWAGVEPQRGQINMTYVNILKTIVQDMEKYGLYALLDFHQDV